MPGEENQVKWRGVQPVDGIRGVWPGRNATRLLKRGQRQGAGQAIIYEVPVDMLLFISSLDQTTRLSLDGERTAYVGVRNAGGALQSYLGLFYFDIKGQQSLYRTYVPAIEVPAEWDIVINNDAVGTDTSAAIYGWLEDA